MKSSNSILIFMRKETMLTNWKIRNKCFAIVLLFSGCASLISTYDQYSYVQTTSLKVDALNLMSEATDDYSKHEVEAKVVSSNIQKILEYEKHRPKNTLTTQQWQLISDTSGNLFGGFIKEWKAKHVLKPGYIPLKQTQVTKAFDYIITLESAKIH